MEVVEIIWVKVLYQELKQRFAVFVAKRIDIFLTKSGKSGHGGGDDLTLN